MTDKPVVGDILKLARPGYAIIHCVNTLGTMGAGLALQVARKWPGVEKQYKQVCTRYSSDGVESPHHSRLLGSIDIHITDDNITIVNMFTQSTVGRTGRHTEYCALYQALEYAFVETEGKTCLFPYGMGCGLGGADWQIVELAIRNMFHDAFIVKLPE